MTGKGEPQHSKSLQLSVKFCSLLLAASLSTVSHHHVRLSRLGSNPRQVKTPCTRYGFHDNSITFWCRITLFHRFGAKVKTSDTKRKKGQDKITREFDLLHLQESLSYASLLSKGFCLKTCIFPYFLVLIEAPEGAVQLNIRTPNNLPKSSASTVEILRNFRGEDGDLTFFRMENSWKFHQMKSDPKVFRGVLVPCVFSSRKLTRNINLCETSWKSSRIWANFTHQIGWELWFTSLRFRGISRLPEVLSPAFLQIWWEVPTRQLHILSNSPIHESQLKVACFPESFRSFRAKNLKPPFLVTSRLSQGFSRFVASASSNGIELEMMPENITCSSQKDWKSSTPGRFGRIRPMWLRPSQQRSIWDVSK